MSLQDHTLHNHNHHILRNLKSRIHLNRPSSRLHKESGTTLHQSKHSHNKFSTKNRNRCTNKHNLTGKRLQPCTSRLYLPTVHHSSHTDMYSQLHHKSPHMLNLARSKQPDKFEPNHSTPSMIPAPVVKRTKTHSQEAPLQARPI